MDFCELSCKFASFPDKPMDGQATCRTFVGLFCSRKKRVVHKNLLCKWYKGRD